MIFLCSIIGGKKRCYPSALRGRSARKIKGFPRMGKIKSKLIKRTANTLLKKEIAFAESFETNKKILGSEMPSKKLRNQLAGYLARIKKYEKQHKPKILENEQK